MEPTGKTTKIAKAEFGGLVNYRLFCVWSRRPFFPLSCDIATAFNSQFVLLEDFSLEETPDQPRFQQAFMQFCCVGETPSLTDNPVSRLNLLLFKNKTEVFYHSQSQLPFSQSEETFDFGGHWNTHYALDKKGVSLCKWPEKDVDYLLIAFSHKENEKDLENFSKKILRLPCGPVERTPLMKVGATSSSTSHRTKLYAADVLQFISIRAEIQISKYMKSFSDQLLTPGNFKMTDRNFPKSTFDFSQIKICNF
ncbi:MAG: hypothetical protein J5642_07195 [Bacteroidales bacterium]|nr:hypothetical protein [Bacteroidales bacterium]